MPTISSPCVRNCCLDEADVCLGCFRSIEEILQWSAATEQQKQAVVERAVTRKQEHRRRYGSRQE